MPQTVNRHRVRREPGEIVLDTQEGIKGWFFDQLGNNVVPAEDMSDEDWTRKRDNLLDFTQHTFSNYKADKFHTDVCKHITDLVVKEETQNLMLFAPPQHGKSEIVSTRLPSFWLSHHPELPVGLISYGASLAFRNSRYARMVFETPQYAQIFPEYEKDVINWRTSDWHLRDHKGYVMAAGVGGPITGHGFGLGIIDDPVENWAAAQSEVTRESIWQWWLGTFKTRMWEGGRIILMMCMPGETPILMADGTWRPLDTIRKGEMVKTYDGGKLVDKIVEAFLPQGKRRVLEIKTGNHTVKATPNHPFMVERKNGIREWIRADEIKKGDLIVVLGQIDEGKNPRRLTKEDCWALGYMFGDGWLTYNPRKDTGAMRWITCVAKGIYPERNERILQYMKDRLDVSMRFIERSGYWRTEVARVGRWFESLGLRGNAHSKQIPDIVFQLPAHLRRSFLSGLVDADGHINNKQRAELVFTSGEFTKQVKLLAEQSGYRTTNINRQHGIYDPPGSPKPIEADSYRIQFQINKIVESEFETSRVRSVKASNSVPVYDLTVADTHNFIAWGCVVHNTRWHEDDLAGRILTQEGRIEEGGKWKVIAYPALAESEDPANDILGREFGEALAPSRFSAKFLIDFRSTQSSHVWNAEYQQHPTAPEGDFFKIGKIEIVEAIPAEICSIIKLDELSGYAPINIKQGVRFWDLAATEKKTLKKDPDSTSGTLMAEHENIYYLLDNINEQMGPYEVEDIIKLTSKVDGKIVKIRIEQEPGSAGKSLIANYVKLLAGFDVIGIPATGDKMVRASAYAAQLNAGNVKMLKSPWNRRVLMQYASFPRGAHDDDIDSGSGAFNDMTGEEQWGGGSGSL